MNQDMSITDFFTLDMNQDMSITEGFKLPTMLHHFLGGNKRHRFGIIGFTEKSYTRTTSLSGEMAGAAEFAFVTIVQRMLRSALRIRMHYGHPDLMSGILARTIGFHKASHGVNVNEDIFAGYECLARGVPIGFCEWIWFWKGRDTSLRLVAMFNNKLAEGAAQQVRSRDLHFLNCNLDWLSRSSLLFGTIGFYWMSVFLYASIRLYIWALVLFEVSGVSNYEIGLVGGTISMAWAFQLGYVMALPGLIENTVQFGLLNGVIRFLRYLIASVFFHAFMLQITYEGFLTGMYTNSAAYAGTGRGYDLIPNDITRHFMTWGYSHYWKAVEFGFLLVWYAAITSESFLSYFLRTLTIWVLSRLSSALRSSSNARPTRMSFRRRAADCGRGRCASMKCSARTRIWCCLRRSKTRSVARTARGSLVGSRRRCMPHRSARTTSSTSSS
jgi:callose synthase